MSAGAGGDRRAGGSLFVGVYGAAGAADPALAPEQHEDEAEPEGEQASCQGSGHLGDGEGAGDAGMILTPAMTASVMNACLPARMRASPWLS